MDPKATQGSTSGYAKSISLPEVFRNLKNAKIFAVDIGMFCTVCRTQRACQRSHDKLSGFFCKDSCYNCVKNG